MIFEIFVVYSEIFFTAKTGHLDKLHIQPQISAFTEINVVLRTVMSVNIIWPSIRTTCWIKKHSEQCGCSMASEENGFCAIFCASQFDYETIIFVAYISPPFGFFPLNLPWLLSNFKFIQFPLIKALKQRAREDD